MRTGGPIDRHRLRRSSCARLLARARADPAAGPAHHLRRIPRAGAGHRAAGSRRRSRLPPATPAPRPPAATPIAGGWTFVGRKACPDESRFECITLSVPRDHYTADGPTWDVTFAIQRATKQRLGTFVVITGGPGSSGIASADGYTDYYPTSIPESYDIVFLDQRGVGLSHPIQCPTATAPSTAAPCHRTIPPGPQRPERWRRRTWTTAWPRPRGPGGPPVLCDAPGRRGPRGDPRLPRRRHDAPLRRELRNTVRADLRHAPPGPHRHPVPGRPRRPHPRRRQLLRGGRALLRRRAHGDAQRLCGRDRLRRRLRGSQPAGRVRPPGCAPGGRHPHRLPDGGRHDAVADAHGLGSRERGGRLPLLPWGPRDPPACPRRRRGR